MRKLIYLSCLLSLPCYASSATVNTWVNAEGTASYFYEEHHPTKYDAGRWTYCPGGESRTGAASFRSEPENIISSGNNLGRTEWNYRTPLNSHNGLLNELINQHLAWETKFDENDYMFRIDFKKRVPGTRETVQRTTCSSRSWRYAVNVARTKFLSSIVLTVPNNIYMVRIRSKVNATVNPDVKIEQVANTVNAEGTVVFNNLELPDGTSYFFVRPNHQIRLVLTSETDTRNVDVLASFEIRFVGHTRCEGTKDLSGKVFPGIVDEFKKLSGHSADAPLSRQLIGDAFGLIQKKLTDNVVDDSLDKAILFLGCLTSDLTIKALLHENNAVKVNEILNGIADFSAKVSQIRSRQLEEDRVSQERSNQQVREEEGRLQPQRDRERREVERMNERFRDEARRNIERVELDRRRSNQPNQARRDQERLGREQRIIGSVLTVLNTVDLMSRNAVATSVIQGLAPLCSRYPVIGLDGKIRGHITGYLYMRQKLDTIANYLKMNRTEMTPIAKYFRGLLASMQHLSGHTYRDVLLHRISELDSLENDFDKNGKVRLVLEAQRHFALMPAMSPNRDLVGMKSELENMVAKIKRISAEFNRLFRLFARQSSDNVNLTDFEKAISDFEKAEREFKHHFQGVYALFSSDYASNFGNTVADINNHHIGETRKFLEIKFNGFLKSFSDLQMNKINGFDLSEELSKCIENPILAD